MSAAIRASGLSKRFRRVAAGYPLRTLKSVLLSGGAAPASDEPVITALDDVSFEVQRGEAFGVIGGNGSGKSTLLKVIAGILPASTGTVAVDGRLAALIELGAGFHPEISGRENIFINGALLGLSRQQVAERFDAIVELSGLGDFLEEPVKNYSAGMYVRLGFAVAIHTLPDVLLVDEVLAVGDEAFAHACLRHIEEHLAAGRTLLVVSHALTQVEELCDRVLWLDRGQVRLVGSPRRVVDAYRQAVAAAEGRVQEAPQDSEPDSEPLRWGSGDAEIVAARMLVAGEQRQHLRSGEEVTFALEVLARRSLADFVFGIAVSTPRGVECWGTNTDLEGWRPERFRGRGLVLVHCPALQLAPGEYLMDAAIHARDGTPYDYRRRLLTFRVTAGGGGSGVYRPEHRWSFEGDLAWQVTGGPQPAR